MASRMERYYSNTSSQEGRSKKNKELYDKINEIDSYNNIEAVATIEKTNEIDITKIKQMLKNRENYNKEKKYLSIINEDVKKDNKRVLYTEDEEEKNYDIVDALNKAKNNRSEILKDNKLDDEKYNILKSLKLKDKNYTEGEELKDLINSITKNKKINSDSLDEKDLLSELKSDTVVGDADSIKDLIDKEKNNYKLENSIDNSFYTSSLGFTKNDFESLIDINKNVKKNNILMIILFIVIGVVVMGVVGYIVFFSK